MVQAMLKILTTTLCHSSAYNKLQAFVENIQQGMCPVEYFQQLAYNLLFLVLCLINMKVTQTGSRLGVSEKNKNWRTQNVNQGPKAGLHVHRVTYPKPYGHF